MSNMFQASLPDCMTVLLICTRMHASALYIQFAKTFTLDCSHGEVQPLKIEVHNVDDVCNISDLTQHSLIGDVELMLAEIVAERQVTRTLRLKEPKK